MRILALAFLALAAVSSAAPDPGKAVPLEEWQRTRLALERAGFKVNHFARTPQELRWEQDDIRRQIERLSRPAAPAPAYRYGSGNGVSRSAVTRPSRIRKAPPVGKLGASRKVN